MPGDPARSEKTSQTEAVKLGLRVNLPQVPQRYVHRPELYHQVDILLTRKPLLGVTAPLGFGKRSLVLAYIREKLKADPALNVIWIESERSSRSFLPAFEAVLKRLAVDVPSFKFSDLDGIDERENFLRYLMDFKAILYRLLGEGKRFIIALCGMNVNETELESYNLPTGEQCKVLVTGRFPVWSHTFNVPPLTREQAITLLRNYVGDDRDVGAFRLAAVNLSDYVGGVPEILTTVGLAAAKGARTLDSILRDLTSRTLSLISILEPNGNGDYDMSLLSHVRNFIDELLTQPVVDESQYTQVQILAEKLVDLEHENERLRRQIGRAPEVPELRRTRVPSLTSTRSAPLPASSTESTLGRRGLDSSLERSVEFIFPSGAIVSSAPVPQQNINIYLSEVFAFILFLNPYNIDEDLIIKFLPSSLFENKSKVTVEAAVSGLLKPLFSEGLLVRLSHSEGSALEMNSALQNILRLLMFERDEHFMSEMFFKAVFLVDRLLKSDSDGVYIQHALSVFEQFKKYYFHITLDEQNSTYLVSMLNSLGKFYLKNSRLRDACYYYGKAQSILVENLHCTVDRPMFPFGSEAIKELVQQSDYALLLADIEQGLGDAKRRLYWKRDEANMRAVSQHFDNASSLLEALNTGLGSIFPNGAALTARSLVSDIVDQALEENESEHLYMTFESLFVRLHHSRANVLFLQMDHRRILATCNKVAFSGLGDLQTKFKARLMSHQGAGDRLMASFSVSLTPLVWGDFLEIMIARDQHQGEHYEFHRLFKLGRVLSSDHTLAGSLKRFSRSLNWLKTIGSRFSPELDREYKALNSHVRSAHEAEIDLLTPDDLKGISKRLFQEFEKKLTSFLEKKRSKIKVLVSTKENAWRKRILTTIKQDKLVGEDKNIFVINALPYGATVRRLEITLQAAFHHPEARVEILYQLSETYLMLYALMASSRDIFKANFWRSARRYALEQAWDYCKTSEKAYKQINEGGISFFRAQVKAQLLTLNEYFIAENLPPKFSFGKIERVTVFIRSVLSQVVMPDSRFFGYTLDRYNQARIRSQRAVLRDVLDIPDRIDDPSLESSANRLVSLNKREYLHNPRNVVKLIRYFLRHDQYRKCIRVSDEYLNRFPEDVEVLRLRSQANFALGEYENAIVDLRTALFYSPGNPLLNSLESDAKEALGSKHLDLNIDDFLTDNEDYFQSCYFDEFSRVVEGYRKKMNGKDLRMSSAEFGARFVKSLANLLPTSFGFLGLDVELGIRDAVGGIAETVQERAKLKAQYVDQKVADQINFEVRNNPGLKQFVKNFIDQYRAHLKLLKSEGLKTLAGELVFAFFDYLKSDHVVEDLPLSEKLAQSLHYLSRSKNLPDRSPVNLQWRTRGLLTKVGLYTDNGELYSGGRADRYGYRPGTRREARVGCYRRQVAPDVVNFYVPHVPRKVR